MRITKSICHHILCILLAVLFTACDKDVHDNEYLLGSGEGAFVVGLHTDRQVSNLNIFIFDCDGNTLLHNDYTDPRELASDYLPVKTGTYSIVAIANCTAENMPVNTTVPDLAEWLKAHVADYPDMLTSLTQESVADGEVKRLRLTLQGGTSGLSLSTLRLLLTVPGMAMPDYKATRTANDEDAPALRLTAEVYRQGTDIRIYRSMSLCAPQSDGTYLAELSLLQGRYDLRLWADRTTDGTTDNSYYNAENLSAVTILTDNYVANGQTDEKDACYATVTAELTGGVTEKPVELIRPFARYRLVATDVKSYRNLVEKEHYPSVEELQVSVTYEGFFPTGFNVVSGKPNDALNTGITYTATPVTAEGYNPEKARQVGADFVLTNGTDSFVSVTIKMVDKRTGNAVSTVRGVKIPYRRGHLTTVTGMFLTAGKATGGVHIDTDWEDEIIVEF